MKKNENINADHMCLKSEIPKPLCESKIHENSHKFIDSAMKKNENINADNMFLKFEIIVDYPRKNKKYRAKLSRRR